MAFGLLRLRAPGLVWFCCGSAPGGQADNTTPVAGFGYILKKTQTSSLIPLTYLFSLFAAFFIPFPFAVSQCSEPGTKAAFRSDDGSGTALLPAH